jgi:hypothetical protein
MTLRMPEFFAIMLPLVLPAAMCNNFKLVINADYFISKALVS